MDWIYLAIAIMGELVGTSAMKASEHFTRLWPAVLVVVGYLVASVFLSFSLRSIPVGIAYAIWSGVGIVTVSIVGWLVYDQHLDTPALVGLALILAGVVIINVFSQSTAH